MLLKFEVVFILFYLSFVFLLFNFGMFEVISKGILREGGVCNVYNIDMMFSLWIEYNELCFKIRVSLWVYVNCVRKIRVEFKIFIKICNLFLRKFRG